MMERFALVFSLCATQVSPLPDHVEVELTHSFLDDKLTDSEYWYGLMRGRFGVAPWEKQASGQQPRNGRKLGGTKGPRPWPNGRIPYEFGPSIDINQWKIIQNIFSNYSSVTDLRFVPRTPKDTDYLLITEDIEEWGCGCCSIGLGFLEGSGPHVLVLAPVSKGGCGVNVVGGTHELMHILGFSHTQNRADRCNYIDVNTDQLRDWGEWRPSQLTEAADWFTLRIPYDCSSYVHYYQLQGVFWKKDIEKKVDQLMELQGCENTQRGRFLNNCLVTGGFTSNGTIINDGYEICFEKWDKKHSACVEVVKKEFSTFKLIDPNGRCKRNGINRVNRKVHQLSEWDIWAINAAYDGPLPRCQKPKSVGNGICNTGNNHIGCDYDGGDCCLPRAKNQDCIDPCGVRNKFYGGKNRACRAAPTTKEFCSDHYWYGPNQCSKKYCQETEERFLQWQCKKTCGLCDVPASNKEMDKICHAVANKSNKNNKSGKKPSKTTKPLKPSKIAKPVNPSKPSTLARPSKTGKTNPKSSNSTKKTLKKPKPGPTPPKKTPLAARTNPYKNKNLSKNKNRKNGKGSRRNSPRGKSKDETKKRPGKSKPKGKGGKKYLWYTLG